MARGREGGGLALISKSSQRVLEIIGRRDGREVDEIRREGGALFGAEVLDVCEGGEGREREGGEGGALEGESEEGGACGDGRVEGAQGVVGQVEVLEGDEGGDGVRERAESVLGQVEGEQAGPQDGEREVGERGEGVAGKAEVGEAGKRGQQVLRQRRQCVVRHVEVRQRGGRRQGRRDGKERTLVEVQCLFLSLCRLGQDLQQHNGV